jgi:glycosyltransferase involved in cell wall biosynthesis
VTLPARQTSSKLLEYAVASHAAIFVMGTSWAFGGNADWVRTPISIWGTLGLVLTIAIISRRESRRLIITGTIPWIWPIVALSAVVAISCLTPGFRYLSFGKDAFMMPLRLDWWIPSSASSETTLRSLWLFDGIYFSCLNICLAVTRRRTIRAVLAVLVGNTLALSVFGTVQKLEGSTGIYFGAVKSPQSNFFSSFVYDNHWGAFTILMLGACTGLILRYIHGRHGEGFFRGPAFTGLVSAALIAISIPLSGSRACTLLLGILALVAVVQGTPRISRALSHSGITPAGTIAGMAIAAIFTIAGFWFVAGDVIQARASKTKEQVAAMWEQGGIGSRGVLYHDTWRMARARLLFGWGMGSFPTVFSLYNTQESKIDRIPVVYHDAHSDWIQSVAEVGIAGTAFVGLAVLLPAMAVRRLRVTPVPYFLITGTLLIAAYAWIEFPFGNIAVVLAWWLCFFSAVQYIRLTVGSGDGAHPAGAMYSVVILTLNEERALPACLASLTGCDDIVILDSGSTDRTTELARAAGARVFGRPFDTFAGQHNYAQRNIPFRHPWVFHLDADERMTPELDAECRRESARTDLDGFRVAPRMIFEGRWIPHCTDFPAYQARFVMAPRFEFIQVGHGQREAPEMMLVNLQNGYLHDLSVYGEAAWLAKHRKYAKAEADALAVPSEDDALTRIFSRKRLSRRRALKRLSFRLPFRPYLRFAYQYGLRRGFLDGRQGLHYCLLVARYEGFISDEIKRLKVSD